MISKVCRFDPIRDIEPVSQTGWINLYEAYATHTIPSVIDDSEVAYNEIENPSSILGKPNDIFEATRMQSYINSVGVNNDSESNGENSVPTV